jgi:hypothetical protein
MAGPVSIMRLEGCAMTENSPQDLEATAQLHNRFAKQVVAQILNATRTAGGSYSDLLVICESVLVGGGYGVLQVRSRREGS